MLEYTAIDFETANSYRGSPCAVGLVRVRDGRVVDELHFLIKPPSIVSHFDKWNTILHGVTADMVADQLRWKEALPRIVNFIDGDTVVAHNAAFDTGVIRHACTADGIEWPILSSYAPWSYLAGLSLSQLTGCLSSWSLSAGRSTTTMSP